MDVKVPGDLVYVLGITGDELGASEYYQMMNWIGLNVPEVDADKAIRLYGALYRAIKGGLVSSCHAVGRGGLAVHLALSAMGGNLGMDIDLGSAPVTGELTNTRLLYSESAGRFVVAIDPKRKVAFEDLMDGLPCALVGRVTDADTLQVSGVDGKLIIEERLGDLKDAWKEPFGGLI